MTEKRSAVDEQLLTKEIDRNKRTEKSLGFELA